MLKGVREVESSPGKFSDCGVFVPGKFNTHERLQHSLSIRLAWLYSVRAWVPLALIHNLGY